MVPTTLVLLIPLAVFCIFVLIWINDGYKIGHERCIDKGIDATRIEFSTKNVSTMMRKKFSGSGKMIFLAMYLGVILAIQWHTWLDNNSK